jgi:hypothetical protein
VPVRRIDVPDQEPIDGHVLGQERRQTRYRLADLEVAADLAPNFQQQRREPLHNFLLPSRHGGRGSGYCRDI